MQAQDLSYKLNNDIIAVHGCKELDFAVSTEVFSLENVYTPARDSFGRSSGTYRSDSLVWGNAEPADGEVVLEISDSKYGKAFDVSARLAQPIRGVKLRFDDLPVGTLISLTDEDKAVTEYGICLKYPEGWRSLSTPLLVFKLDGGRFLYIRCLDKTVSEKRFFIKKTGDGVMRVDVVQDARGVDMSNTFAAPRVEVGVTDDADTIYSLHSDYIKAAFGLDEYAECRVAPSWLKDIALVVTMHMQSFTGYMFHTYARALDDMKRLCELIDGRKVLVYLAGWEGRYYYKYGDYTPDERMGGAKELKAAVDGMHALGCKVMAMYGMNMANRAIPAVDALADENEFVSVSGARYRHGSVDWEGAHHYDFGGFANLNIAKKGWSDYLFGQINTATERFGFDGAFLDIAACYINDGQADVYDGVVRFCDRLRTIKPDFLVSGEGYYDGLSRAMPLFQSGHTDGRLHYHDRVSEKLFTRFSREFAHLCIGDPSRGSSGVHELGENDDRITPLRRGIIPTIALVEDTLDKAPDKVKEILKTAEAYSEGRFE